MTDIAHPDVPPRNSALMIALHLTAGNVSAAELELLELIAWLSFDKPKHSELPDNAMRVLMMDGSRDHANVGCALFSHLGHTAVSVHNGTEAVTMADVFHPDVVLVDLDVRMVDGREVARLIRARRHGAYIVGVTSWDGHNERKSALAAGCNEVVTKPVDLGKIRGLLRNIGPR